MPNMIQLTCDWCGKSFERFRSEYNAMKRKNPNCGVYCSRGCAGKGINAPKKTTEWIQIEKVCPICGKKFTTSCLKGYTGEKDFTRNGASFCSRGCASKGSVTDYRRQRAREMGLATFGSRAYEENLQDLRRMMLKREGYRYKDAEQYFIDHNIPYEFEYIIEDRIFDLYLPSINTVVEFDEPCHTGIESDAIDLLKDEIAKKNGMKIVRIKIQTKEIIAVNLIESLLVGVVDHST